MNKKICLLPVTLVFFLVIPKIHWLRVKQLFIVSVLYLYSRHLDPYINALLKKKQSRNKAKKLIRKQKRKEMYDARKKEKLEINEKVRSLEREN